MQEVLCLKFERPELQRKLLETGQAFLLEHNMEPGRDGVWSDNYDGTGQNRLGLLLMLIRAELQPRKGTSPGQLAEWLRRVVDPTTGKTNPCWQEVVCKASRHIRCALGEDLPTRNCQAHRGHVQRSFPARRLQNTCADDKARTPRGRGSCSGAPSSVSYGISSQGHSSSILGKNPRRRQGSPPVTGKITDHGDPAK